MRGNGTVLPLPANRAQADESFDKAPESATMALPTQPTLVKSLRRFTNDVLCLWQIGNEKREAAVLIVDELAINAVQHGRTDMTLLLTLDGAVLRIAVADTGPRVPHPDADLDPDEHGRGVGIVKHLADRVEYHEGARRCLACAWLRILSLPSSSAGGGTAA
ncbi:ATP-binding protein [Streptomyces sp. NPDC092129]|uniref:ATP-binding protein n=1 Tax=Streptomyces sp. NPDC092129 TaxID=3366010 RepID=UPI00380BCA06